MPHENPPRSFGDSLMISNLEDNVAFEGE